MRNPRYLAAILVVMSPKASGNGPLATAECLAAFADGSTILIVGEGSAPCNTPVTPPLMFSSHVQGAPPASAFELITIGVA
jgi:hypothetical protein